MDIAMPAQLMRLWTTGTRIMCFLAVAAPSIVSARGWLYSPEWNMMRVTRRGPGVPAEWFSCDIRSHAFVIRLMCGIIEAAFFWSIMLVKGKRFMKESRKKLTVRANMVEVTTVKASLLG